MAISRQSSYKIHMSTKADQISVKDINNAKHFLIEFTYLV